ncbi:MAG: hypothetical protein ABF856_12325, partial [Acetobacter aceti]
MIAIPSWLTTKTAAAAQPTPSVRVAKRARCGPGRETQSARIGNRPFSDPQGLFPHRRIPANG